LIVDNATRRFLIGRKSLRDRQRKKRAHRYYGGSDLVHDIPPFIIG
jgi:hypothetical protein